MSASAPQTPDTVQAQLCAAATQAARQASLARQGIARLADTVALHDELSPAGEDALRYTAKLYGIPTRHRQLKYMAVNLVDELASDIGRIKPEPNKTVRIFAASRDLMTWSQADILPRSAYHETCESLRLASEPASSSHEQRLQRQLLRCKLAAAFSGMLICDLVGSMLDGTEPPTPADGLPENVRNVIADVNAELG